MPYLNLDLDYFDHPKVVRLVGQLGRGADLLPVRLWCYCGKYHADSGELIGYSPLEIETAIKWWGQAGKAAEALLFPFMGKPGFLEKMENGFKVHDWQEINGHIAALRERGKAGAKARWEKVRSDANAMLKHSSSNAYANAPNKEGKEGDQSWSSSSSLGGDPRGGAAPNPMETFDEARRLYPGPRRGLSVEWVNFTKKHPAFREIVPLLIPAIQAEKAHKEALRAAKAFCPEWKNFQTWINQSCWTQEFPEVIANGADKPNPGQFKTAQQRKDGRIREVMASYPGAGVGPSDADYPPLRLSAEGTAGG